MADSHHIRVVMHLVARPTGILDAQSADDGPWPPGEQVKLEPAVDVDGAPEMGGSQARNRTAQGISVQIQHYECNQQDDEQRTNDDASPLQRAGDAPRRKCRFRPGHAHTTHGLVDGSAAPAGKLRCASCRAQAAFARTFLLRTQGSPARAFACRTNPDSTHARKRADGHRNRRAVWESHSAYA